MVLGATAMRKGQLRNGTNTHRWQAAASVVEISAEGSGNSLLPSKAV